MQHLTVLGLLLACAVSLSSCGVALENGAPILWANSVSQLTDFPTQNGAVAPNPWNYLQRMGFYRLLIAATDPFMGSMGTNATDSPLWGLPLQLAWMITSGELHCTNCCRGKMKPSDGLSFIENIGKILIRDGSSQRQNVIVICAMYALCRALC